MDIHYIISWYDKDTNSLVGEVKADAIPFTDLQQLFTLIANGVPGYDSHLIDQQQAQALLTWIPIVFDFNRYIYQLDCFQRLNVPTA